MRSPAAATGKLYGAQKVAHVLARFQPEAHKRLIWMVGAEGFEPPTLCSQSRCATRLRYAPTRLIVAQHPSPFRPLPDPAAHPETSSQTTPLAPPARPLRLPASTFPLPARNDLRTVSPSDSSCFAAPSDRHWRHWGKCSPKRRARRGEPFSLPAQGERNGGRHA